MTAGRDEEPIGGGPGARPPIEEPWSAPLPPPTTARLSEAARARREALGSTPPPAASAPPASSARRRGRWRAAAGSVVGAALATAALVLVARRLERDALEADLAAIRDRTALREAGESAQVRGVEARVEASLGLARAAIEAARAADGRGEVTGARRLARRAVDLLDALDSARTTEMTTPLGQDEARRVATSLAARRPALRHAALVLVARSHLRERGPAWMAHAQVALTAVLEADASHDAARFTQAELLLATDCPGRALAELEPVVARRPGWRRAAVAHARALVALELDLEVVAATGAALERLDDEADAEPDELLHEPPEPREPLRLELLLARADAALRAGDVAVARDGIERAGALCAQEAPSPTLELLRARLLFASGERLAGREALRARVEATTDVAAPLAQADALLAAGAADEARAAADIALARDPRSSRALALRAEAELACLDLDAARASAQAVLDLAGRDPGAELRAMRALAQVEHAGGDAAAALELARQARALAANGAPGAVECALVLGWIELDPRLAEELSWDAGQQLSFVLRARPGCAEARRGLALAELGPPALHPWARTSRGDTARAVARLRETLARAPNDPFLLAALARCQPRVYPGHRARALRVSRDPRRPEGRAFAIALREELRARDATTPDARVAHLRVARAALRVAVSRQPLFCHALARGHALDHAAGASGREAALAALGVLELDPDCPAARELRARLVDAPVTVDGTPTPAAPGLPAGPPRRAPPSLTLAGAAGRPDVPIGELRARVIEAAIQARGPTLELLVLRAALEPTGRAPADIEAALARWEEVVARDDCSPDALRALEAQLATVGALRLDPALSAALAPRAAALGAKRERLARSITDAEARLAELAPALAARLDAIERGGSGAGSSSAPLRAAILDAAAALPAPWRPEGWRLLVRARSAAGDAWGALAAGLRAAALDARAAGDLLRLVRAASRAPVPSGDPVALLAAPRGGPAPDPDLDALLRVAPVVVRAVAGDLDEAGAKAAHEALERAIDRDPTGLAAPALAGLLCDAVGQHEIAQRHLLLVAHVLDHGEAWYLAAVSHAGQPEADLDAAGEWLLAARRAGYAWEERALAEPRLGALRASSRWAFVTR